MPLDKTKNYNFIPKNGSSNLFKNLPKLDYKKSSYGTILTSSLPSSASVKVECLPYSTTRIADRKHIYALKNTLNSYTTTSPHYAYSSSLGNKETQRINLVNIPSIFYGSSINKGSVELSFEVSGTVIAKLNDINKNGELIQVSGTSGLNNTAGVVLYNEGIILLTGSWALGTGLVDNYVYSSTSVGDSTTTDSPKWIR
jgi:hypothetical protein